METSGMKTGRARFARLLVCLTAIALLSIGLALPASAAEVAVEPGGIHVERKDATAGSTLRWEWQASSDVVFSISRSTDTATVLYSSEGRSNSSSLSVSADATYLLLWQNPGNASLTLDFSVNVDAGSGPVLILLLVVIVVIGTLAFIYYIVTKRDRAKRVKGQEPPRILPVQPQNQWQVSNVAWPYQKRPSTFPFPIISPIFAGGIYGIGTTIDCPYCGSMIPGKSRFCVYCLGKLQ